MSAPGEHLHETCRHGMLTKAFRIDANGETPTVAALCTWKPERAPPALLRAWGGLIDTSDCVGCPCFAEVGI